MIDAPERIWAWPFKDWDRGGCSVRKVVVAGAKDVAYIREDLATTLKPLEWYLEDGNQDVRIATVLGIEYAVIRYSEHTALTGPDFKIVTFTPDEEGMDAACSAAQADYERRILSALTTRPTVAALTTAVKPLEWDGFNAGPYEIVVKDDGTADLLNHGNRDEYGDPDYMFSGYLSLISIDDLKARAQADHERRMGVSIGDVRPALAEAAKLFPNCIECGRIIDPREISEGGDPHGCEMQSGEWVCSSECEEAVIAKEQGNG